MAVSCQCAEHRDLVRLAIMETYFPEKKSVIFPKNKPYSLDSYEGEFFEDRKSPNRIKMVKQAGFVRTEYFRIRSIGSLPEYLRHDPDAH